MFSSLPSHLGAVFAGMADALAQVGLALQKALPQIESALHSLYKEAGQPYGDNPEGRERWFNEQNARWEAQTSSPPDALLLS